MSRRKRQEEEPLTNDLEVAAAFAQIPPVGVGPRTTLVAEEDGNEIDVDSDDEEAVAENLQPSDPTDLPVGDKGSSTPTTSDPNAAYGEESDAESDFDLTEALQNMEDPHEEDEDNEAAAATGLTSARAAPQTTHEINAYHASVRQVEAALGTSLQVPDRLPQQATQPAGHVQHFMVEERTLVVRSLPGLPLEEGALLVLRQPPGPNSLPQWIPLGKILEVFGPVSQPMYSIRLPEPIPGENPTSEAEQASEDPWCANGRYTQLLRRPVSSSATPIVVHYLPQQAKIINAEWLLAHKPRGSDASNVHDEEVQHSAEMDYSDDEQERQARRGRKGRGGRGAAASPRMPLPPPHTANPVGFYASRLPPGTAYSYGNPGGSTMPPPAAAPPPEESDTIYYD
jgi:H/ACA ribonucleoprotein complex non-core subunit NAF1